MAPWPYNPAVPSVCHKPILYARIPWSDAISASEHREPPLHQSLISDIQGTKFSYAWYSLLFTWRSNPVKLLTRLNRKVQQFYVRHCAVNQDNLQSNLHPCASLPIAIYSQRIADSAMSIEETPRHEHVISIANNVRRTCRCYLNFRSMILNIRYVKYKIHIN